MYPTIFINNIANPTPKPAPTRSAMYSLGSSWLYCLKIRANAIPPKKKEELNKMVTMTNLLIITGLLYSKVKSSFIQKTNGGPISIIKPERERNNHRFFSLFRKRKNLNVRAPNLNLVCLVRGSKMQTCKKILQKIIASKLFLVKVMKLIGEQQLEI